MLRMMSLESASVSSARAFSNLMQRRELPLLFLQARDNLLKRRQKKFTFVGLIDSGFGELARHGSGFRDESTLGREHAVQKQHDGEKHQAQSGDLIDECRSKSAVRLGKAWGRHLDPQNAANSGALGNTG